MSLPYPINPALEDLPVYQPGRPIEEVAREIGVPASEIIKLASNENPLGPSPAALQAMREILSKLHLYPDGNAFYLKQGLAAKLDVQPANLIFGNGSNEIIEFVGHALIAPGVDVVVSQYCFAVYPLVTKLFGGNLVTVPAKRYGHDLSAMLKAITPRTRVVFVANPNNPTGTVVPAETLLGFVEAVPPEVVIALDEAYLDFLDKPADFLPLIRSARKPNLLLMRTFSKIHGLAGLRIGYGIGCAELVAVLEKVRQPFNTNAIAQAGALAALDDAGHVQRTRENNTVGLRYLEETCRKLGLEFVPSAANFVLVKVGEGGRVFEEMQRLGVIVRPMGGYELPEWVRITIGSSAENERCVEALSKVLGKKR